jgi:hypothetical protein
MLGMGGRPYREADHIQAEGRDHGAHSTQEHNPVQWPGSRVSHIGEHQDDQDSQRPNEGVYTGWDGSTG